MILGRHPMRPQIVVREGILIQVLVKLSHGVANRLTIAPENKAADGGGIPSGLQRFSQFEHGVFPLAYADDLGHLERFVRRDGGVCSAPNNRRLDPRRAQRLLQDARPMKGVGH